MAALERKRQSKFATRIKPKAQHFTIHEFHVLKRSRVELRHTEIATCKNAVDELEGGKVAIGKVASLERAVFVFSRGQDTVVVKGFVLEVVFLVCHVYICNSIPIESDL